MNGILKRLLLLPALTAGLLLTGLTGSASAQRDPTCHIHTTSNFAVNLVFNPSGFVNTQHFSFHRVVQC